jgi:hypothetical protein
LESFEANDADRGEYHEDHLPDHVAHQNIIGAAKFLHDLSKSVIPTHKKVDLLNNEDHRKAFDRYFERLSRLGRAGEIVDSDSYVQQVRQHTEDFLHESHLVGPRENVDLSRVIPNINLPDRALTVEEASDRNLRARRAVEAARRNAEKVGLDDAGIRRAMRNAETESNREFNAVLRTQPLSIVNMNEVAGESSGLHLAHLAQLARPDGRRLRDEFTGHIGRVVEEVHAGLPGTRELRHNLTSNVTNRRQLTMYGRVRA